MVAEVFGVRDVGDPVAAVAALTVDAAESALKLIEVDYEVLPAVVNGVDALKPGAPLIHDVPRLSAAPVIDGKVDEAAWAGAAEYELGYEISPGDNTVPEVKTTARIGYTNDALYVSFIAADPKPGDIRAHLRDRDGFSAPPRGRFWAGLNVRQILVKDAFGARLLRRLRPRANSNRQVRH